MLYYFFFSIYKRSPNRSERDLYTSTTKKKNDVYIVKGNLNEDSHYLFIYGAEYKYTIKYLKTQTKRYDIL